MKKQLILIITLICLILTACGSSQSAAGSYAPNQEESIPVSEETLQYDENGPFSQSSEAIPEPDASAGDFDNTIGDPQQENTPAIQGEELSFEDFDFYYDIMYYGIPEEAVYPAIKYAEGEWKYNLAFRYDTTQGFYYDELGYAELDLDYDKQTMIIQLHPRIGNDGDESWPTDDAEVAYQPFEGGFDENNSLRLYGNDAVIDVRHYYACEGREYFVAEMWISEEEYGIFLMTRGQN
ncbi:MAG: hypothetical protein IJL85_03370 [Erysipelotrichaceae bacterium]|nr:hypothetical protein [Erysipelotrichaceae bacterium]